MHQVCTVQCALVCSAGICMCVYKQSEGVCVRVYVCEEVC